MNPNWKEGIKEVIQNYIVSEDWKKLRAKYGKTEATKRIREHYQKKNVDFPERVDYAMEVLEEELLKSDDRAHQIAMSKLNNFMAKMMR